MIAIIILSVALAASAILARYWFRGLELTTYALRNANRRALNEEAEVERLRRTNGSLGARIDELETVLQQDADRIDDLGTRIDERDAIITTLHERVEVAERLANIGSSSKTIRRDSHDDPWTEPARRVPGQAAFDEKVGVAKLAMDCACCHPAECDCRTTYLQFRDLAQEQA